MKIVVIALFSFFLFFPCACSKAQIKSEKEVSYSIQIPTAGNSWVMNNSKFIATEIVTADGIRNWSNANHALPAHQ